MHVGMLPILSVSAATNRARSSTCSTPVVAWIPARLDAAGCPGSDSLDVPGIHAAQPGRAAAGADLGLVGKCRAAECRRDRVFRAGGAVGPRLPARAISGGQRAARVRRRVRADLDDPDPRASAGPALRRGQLPSDVRVETRPGGSGTGPGAWLHG